MPPIRTAALILIVVVASACGSTSNDDRTAPPTTAVVSANPESSSTTATTLTSTTSTTATTTTTTASTTAESTPPAEDLLEGRGPIALEQGTYRALPFGEAIGLTVADDVQMLFHSEEIVVFGRSEWESDGIEGVAFTRAVGVMPTDEAGTHQPHEPSIPEAAVNVPDELGAWLATIAQVRILDQGSAGALDGPAEWVDFEVAPSGGPTFACPTGEECLGLVASPSGVYTFVAGEQYRMYRFDELPGIIAWGRANPDTSSEVNLLAAELIDGLITF